MRCVSCLLLLMLSVKVSAQEHTSYIVGAEKISYYPHYDFAQPDDKGFAWALLQAFSRHSGHSFVFEALPIKRLHTELHKGTVDFVYPDNPKWSRNPSLTKYYSQPLVVAMGGTMVKQNKRGTGIDKFKSLSVALGFSPVMWTDRIRNRQVRIVEVANAKAALQMVDIGRVDGADVEYHVAQHLMNSMGKPNALVLDPLLPYDFVSFQLSTVEFPELLKELDRFITTHSGVVEQLKIRYRLKHPNTILTENQIPVEEAVP